MSPRESLGLLAAWLLLAACAVAGVDGPAITAANITLGSHVSGPVVPRTELDGRVVVLEFWGINCPPCIASMPKLEDLHRRFGSQGLLVIGAHAQGGTADEIRRTVAELGVTFTIVEQATVAGAMNFSGIPHCMVFDHTGACVFRGSPGEAHDVIETAVQESPAAVLGGRTFSKLASLAELAKNEALRGSVLRKAQAVVQSRDAETAAEARFIVERLTERGTDMLTRARRLADSDPAAAAALAQRCSTVFKGTDIGAAATALVVGWRRDKEFQARVKLGQQLDRLQALEAAALSVPGGVPPQAVGQAREIARAIEKGWPGSDYATKAATIAADLEGEP